MRTMRSSDWMYLGVENGLLKFKSTKFRKEYFLAPIVNFYDISKQKAIILDARREQEIQDCMNQLRDCTR